MKKECIDIGANLTSPSFHEDLEEVIDRAVINGIKTMIITGTSIRASHEALELAKKKPGILYCTAGVHPHDARHCNDRTLESLKCLSENKEVVALGECGLDYNRNFSPPDVQDYWFEAQIELACHLKKPLFLHERDAHNSFLSILKKHREKLPQTVVHCFTGNEQELKAYISQNFYIGITGWICDERRGVHLRNILKYIPLDRLMIETDAPYLLPRTMPRRPASGRNEPAFLLYTLKMVASCLKKSEEEIASITTENAKKFFEIP
ncbi:MAG: TatD family hydrolase [Candidatus Brocadiae bacterium]|nr:TatD family hydrolase [Candidatus Brocadiia bacterium]